MSCESNGEALVLLAAAVSLQLARSRSPQELELLAAFFEVLGDNLSLWLARLPQNGEDSDQPCR